MASHAESAYAKPELTHSQKRLLDCVTKLAIKSGGDVTRDVILWGRYRTWADGLILEAHFLDTLLEGKTIETKDETVAGLIISDAHSIEVESVYLDQVTGLVEVSMRTATLYAGTPSAPDYAIDSFFDRYDPDEINPETDALS